MATRELDGCTRIVPACTRNVLAFRVHFDLPNLFRCKEL